MSWADENDGDEAFEVDLLGWLEEIRETGYVVDEAPEPQILELIPDPPVEGQPQGYHLKQDGEEVPDDVTPIQVFEVAP